MNKTARKLLKTARKLLMPQLPQPLGLQAANYETSLEVLRGERVLAEGLRDVLRISTARLKTQGRPAGRQQILWDEVTELVRHLDAVIAGMEAAHRSMLVLEAMREPPMRLDANARKPQSRRKKRPIRKRNAQ